MIKLSELVFPKFSGLTTPTSIKELKFIKEAAEDFVDSKGEHKKEEDADEMAKSVEAEKDADKFTGIPLTSTSGMSFLLSQLLGHAKETDTVDSLAASMVDHLKISDPNKFMESTKQFAGIEGWSELMDSISTLARNKSAFAPVTENKRGCPICRGESISPSTGSCPRCKGNPNYTISESPIKLRGLIRVR